MRKGYYYYYLYNNNNINIVVFCLLYYLLSIKLYDCEKWECTFLYIKANHSMDIDWNGWYFMVKDEY